jgi:endonuclease VIII-like 1
MPELAELRLSAEYVNKACDGRTFMRIEKNPVHKGLDPVTPYESFHILAESRGKEMLLHFFDAKTYGTPTVNSQTMKFTFGMSGHFKMTKTGEERKHSHLMFRSTDGYTLSFVDVRRFGKWKWDGWGKDRGFDPTKDYDRFVKDIEDNLDQKVFSRPIGEALLNQRYFNGIGNYLRAEILYRADQDPFETAKDAIQKNAKILSYCKTVPLEAYLLGGGQLKSWENPFGEDSIDFEKWMKCYGNSEMETITDGTGRRLWFDPKWKPLN